MTDSILPHLRFLVAGRLARCFTILPSGSTQEDACGGSAIYAAAGVRIWEEGVGMIARVGCDYPREWLARASRHGIDPRGVRILSEEVDLRKFTAFPDVETKINDNPVATYANQRLAYPKALLGYNPAAAQLDSRSRPTLMTIRQSDVPGDYLDATAAHICPLDFLSHTLLPPTLRGGHINTITLDAGEGYMDPSFFDEMPVILNGLSAFFTNEEKLARLFIGRSTDLWEMAEGLAAMGCDLIVVKRGAAGQYLYDRGARKRWIIPAYPGQIYNLSGAGDAFCGGFLAGLRSSYEPLTAVLQGNISASFVLEGGDPLYALGALPGLARARLESLREKVRRG
jgi:sugar/nucleoside kinase (ribokinase family)